MYSSLGAFITFQSGLEKSCLVIFDMPFRFLLGFYPPRQTNDLVQRIGVLEVSIINLPELQPIVGSIVMLKCSLIFLDLLHAAGDRLKGDEDSDLCLVRSHHLAERPNICNRERTGFDLCDHTGLYLFVESRIPNNSVPRAVKTAVACVRCRLQSEARYRPVRKVVSSVLLLDQHYPPPACSSDSR